MVSVSLKSPDGQIQTHTTLNMYYPQPYWCWLYPRCIVPFVDSKLCSGNNPE